MMSDMLLLCVGGKELGLRVGRERIRIDRR